MTLPRDRILYGVFLKASLSTISVTKLQGIS